MRGSRSRRKDFGPFLVGILTILCPLLLMGAYIPGTMLGSNNLSELSNAATARTNLGLGSASTWASSAVLQTANNLSEGTAATMRTNLGLGSIATQAANSVAITGRFQWHPNDRERSGSQRARRGGLRCGHHGNDRRLCRRKQNSRRIDGSKSGFEPDNRNGVLC